MRSTLLASLLLSAATLTGCTGSGTGSVQYSAQVTGPELVEIEPGVQVVANYEEPVFYSDNYYWRYNAGVWYRSGDYRRRDWVRVEAPAPRVVRIQNPTAYIRFSGQVRTDARPHNLVEIEPGVQVVADYDEPVFYSDNAYWRFNAGVWYRSNDYRRRDWVRVEAPAPRVVRIQNPTAYVRFRGQGRIEAGQPQQGWQAQPQPQPQAHPGHGQPQPGFTPPADRADRKEERKEMKEERKDDRADRKEERKEMKEERKDDRKDAREERKEMKEERKDDRKDAKEERKERKAGK